MPYFKEFSLKRFGCLDFNGDLSSQLEEKDLTSFIKIVYVKAGGLVKIDFETFELSNDAFFFINPGQYCLFDTNCTGTMIYYNRDFYCIQIHDREVACDGLLFNNAYEIPVVYIKPSNFHSLEAILKETHAEMALEDAGTEEMLRLLLKQIIIKCTRIWKHEHLMSAETARPEVEFPRTFSQLIEQHYTVLHAVADYAGLLFITPKSLNKRISIYSKTTPNDLIKNRIILEAKRLLAHTSLNVKEIAYRLGYEDSSYFIRFFTKHTGNSPQKFRIHFTTM